MALQQFQHQRIGGLILDLRNNPGGLLTASVEVAELFVIPAKTIVSLKTSQPRTDEYVSRDLDLAAGLPLIVLVNNGTASGALEIVASALLAPLEILRAGSARHRSRASAPRHAASCSPRPRCASDASHDSRQSRDVPTAPARPGGLLRRATGRQR